MLEFEDVQTKRLGYGPDRFGKDLLREDLGHAVEEVGDDPVKHFDEEREFLKNAAVDVVGKSRSIGCVHCHSTALSTLREVFRRSIVIVVVVIIVRIVPW